MSSQPAESAADLPCAVEACPTVEQLQAFTEGALSLADLKAISTHLLHCSQCETKVSTIVDRADLPAALASHGTAQEDFSPQAGAQVVDSVNSPMGRVKVESSQHHGAAGKENRDLEATRPLQLGQYRLLRQIGRGGMGVVYRAWHERLQREVALKLLPTDQFNDPIGIERLQREMAAAGNVRHPNIVYATDAGEADGVHYLAMEFVAGVDLARLVSRLGPLPVADACELVRQAALGLEHIRIQGMVHRDLKPSNLMLAADGAVKILDLGLARMRREEVRGTELTRPSYLLGTADYVAPEQAADAHRVDIRSDIYSLGCTLFKLLTGNPPFSGAGLQTAVQKVEGHRSLPPPPLRQFRQDVPGDLEQIVVRSLEKNPGDRFQRPQDLVTALEPFCGDSDLAALLRRWHSRPHTDVPKPPDTSPTSSAITTAWPLKGKLAAQWAAGRAAFARALWQRRLWIAAACAMVVLLPIGIWQLGGLIPSRSDLTPPAVIVRKEGKVRITKELEKTGEYKWPGHRHRNNHLLVNEELQTLSADAEEAQLIVLGNYPGGPKGTFRVTIRQGNDQAWPGNVGVIFGLRDESIVNARNASVEATVFQMISLHRLNGPLGKGVAGGGYGMMVKRRKVYIDPATAQILELDPDTAHHEVEFPRDQPVVLEIQLGDDHFKSVHYKVGDRDYELTRLTTPEVNSRFVRADYVGKCGLFNYGHRGTTFSNMEVTRLEPLKQE